MDQLIKPIAYFYYLLVQFKVKQLSLKLNFPKLSGSWIQGIMMSDMDPVWKRFSVPAHGINFFTIGKVENGISTRFISSSPYFQSWLGGYIAQFTDKRDWTIQDHFRLAEADQKNG